MKQTLKILLLTLLYVFALSFALKIIPFDNPPHAFNSLFANKSSSMLTWMKLRQITIVAVMASILAVVIVRENPEKAQFDAIVIGILTVLWGFIFRWTIIGGVGLSWYELTDYLTTGLAVPLLVAVVAKSARGKRQHPTRA